jgi:hypothetical protein
MSNLEFTLRTLDYHNRLKDVELSLVNGGIELCIVNEIPLSICLTLMEYGWRLECSRLLYRCSGNDNLNIATADDKDSNIVITGSSNSNIVINGKKY